MLKQKLDSVKTWLSDPKTKMLLGATAVIATVAVLEQVGIRSHNQFLKDHGLFDEYYTPEED